MLYNLLYPLADEFQLFNLFRYLTFRSGAAVLTSLLISFLFGTRFIDWLRVRQGKGQPIRHDGPETHLLCKQGTPTMGGVMILLSVTLSTLLWADIDLRIWRGFEAMGNPYVWTVLLVTLGFGTIGLMDDCLKISRRTSKGLSGTRKLGLQCAIAGVASALIMHVSGPGMATRLAVPFFKDVFPDIGAAYLLFSVLVMVGASNAVNLTDGLDGLAIVPIMIAAGCFALISYLVGNSVFADYLQIHRVPGSGELTVFCAALIGAGLGFLWYNAPPAMIFMGDTGSLAFGGAIGTIAVITKHELVLVIIGGLFVLEAISVIVQVASYKLTGKRVFKMAPIHHHFEKLGWSEPTVVIRFWIIATILALVGLSTLKLR